MSLCLLLVTYSWTAKKYQTSTQNKVVRFSASGVCIGEIKGEKATLYLSESITENELERRVYPYLKGHGMRKIILLKRKLAYKKPSESPFSVK